VAPNGLVPTRSTAPATVATFDELARCPDDVLDVAVGAALIARDVYEDLDVAAVVEELDELAGPLTGEALAGLPLEAQAAAVSARFCDLGFRGNAQDYYDARNSLLPDVLERRTGIPITLTLVWCRIAQRAGVVAHGVGFPGHFLARVDDAQRNDAGSATASTNGALPSHAVIVDPFENGRIVREPEAKALLRRTLGEGTELHPTLFAPAGPRATLVRMLTNLKAVWASRGEHTRAFVAIDRIVTLVPDSAKMLRERAGIAMRLGIGELAQRDLAKVLELEPQAPDAPHIQKRLAELRGAVRPPPN
jgi:regulator of sirC expression with transglutaminase-like and TPR domain